MLRNALVLAMLAFAGCSTDSPQIDEPDSETPGADTRVPEEDAGGDATAAPDAGPIEDTSMPDMPGPMCEAGETQQVACGLNGRGVAVRPCVDGAFGPAGECQDTDECVEDATQTVACGRNGRGSLQQTCTDGAWTDDGACTDPDQCTDGETRTVACGLNGNGTQEQPCVAGAWDTSAACSDADMCTDGASRTLSCGLNDRGMLAQDCVAGAWQDDGSCVDPDECTDGATQQIACGFNGTQDQMCSVGAWVDVGACEEPVVGYCRTQPATTMGVTGQSSPVILGTAYVQQSTPGAGAGADVVGELVWGLAGTPPSTWTEVAPATYARDVDGLTAGDLANDQWEARVTPAAAGAYEYAFRFSANGGNTWQMCDVNGSVGGAFDTGAVGDLQVIEPELPDACHLQFPDLVYAGEVGQGVEVYGRVTKTGVTGMGSAAANVVGELVVGPPGVDPRINFAGFQTVAGTYNTTALNLGPDEDEYSAVFTPTTAGELAFAFRFSVDGGASWEYCGLRDDRVAAGFGTDRMGYLRVAAGTPEVVDFCHVWQDTLSDDTNTSNLPTVTVEVFEGGVTDSGAASTAIEAEAAAMLPARNPALSSAAWRALPFKGPRPAVPQNYEYEGAPYSPATHPAAGEHNVVVRVREAGSSDWTYCDTDDAAADFRLEAATRLSVTP